MKQQKRAQREEILMKKIITFIVLTTISLNIMAQLKIVQTAGRTQLGEQD